MAGEHVRDGSTTQLTMGPLQSTVEVVAFVALTGMAWFNGVELLFNIFFSFKRWTGKYFYSLIFATSGVLIYQIFVFVQTFAPQLNAYGVTAAIDVGWTFMVTGQSLVLWSRLHLVMRNQLRLRLVLYMILLNGLVLHVMQSGFSQASIKNNQVVPTYKPFDISEKICITVFTAQELIISSIYLYEAVRILRVGEMVQKKSNRRRIQMLFLANLVIIAIDVTTLSLEFSALWGVWCSFKGFGYSVKLKIEFAILNQLRESVKGGSSAASNSAYGNAKSAQDIGLSGKIRARSNVGAKPTGLARHTWEEIEDEERITKTTEIEVKHDAHSAKSGGAAQQDSKSSSELDFALQGV